MYANRTFFVLRVHKCLSQSCYGVLHCSLGGSDTLELEDTLQEADLAVSPECHSYQEYDAIVVRNDGDALEAILM